MSDRYDCVRQEQKALQDTNAFLDKRLREVASENTMFLSQLMDMKEKQIEKYNENNDLIQEVQTMKMKLELANMSADNLKKINEIMSIQKSTSDDKSSESS